MIDTDQLVAEIAKDLYDDLLCDEHLAYGDIDHEWCREFARRTVDLILTHGKQPEEKDDR
jgi:hypothetical protein